MATDISSHTSPTADDESPVPSQVTSGEATRAANDDEPAADGVDARDPSSDPSTSSDRDPATKKGDAAAGGETSTRDTLDLRPRKGEQGGEVRRGQGGDTRRARGTDAPSDGAIAGKVQNSTDATHGQPLAVRAKARKAELEALLETTTDVRARGDIELAVSSVTELLTGDPEHLSATTAAAINLWLEREKHLGETAVKASTSGAK